MKLTAEQIFEISTALHCGLKEASLAIMADSERARWIAAVKAAAEQSLARPDISESNRQWLRENAELAGRPQALAERARERYYAKPAKERGRNLAGQKMGLNDMLSQVQHFSELQRSAVDLRLAERGLPSLRKLGALLKKTHERILKRGKIRNEEEYYAIQEILADVSFNIAEADRDRFAQLAAEFEGRAPRR
jgi:hypothetical protein